jgi:chaperone required for assembly of F1-ATPase
MALKIVLVLIATIVVFGFWAVYFDIPNSFVMIRNLYVSAEARSIEKQREAMGLDPRQWQTPKKKIFQQDALNRLCEAIANADSTEVDKLLSQ